MRPVYAVVSLLDDKYDAEVRRLWAELDKTCGIRSLLVAPIPHFSYHVAKGYDLGALEALLKQAASQTTPFEVSTAGLGLFTGTAPVLHVPVVRTPRLTEVQQHLLQGVLPLSQEPLPHYLPENWMPHITIGHGDFAPTRLARAIRLLAPQAFNWTIPVTNLALIYDTGTEQGVRCSYPFGK